MSNKVIVEGKTGIKVEIEERNHNKLSEWVVTFLNVKKEIEKMKFTLIHFYPKSKYNIKDVIKAVTKQIKQLENNN